MRLTKYQYKRLQADIGGLMTLYAIIKAEKHKEKEPKPRVRFRFLLAEGEGFEPPDPCRSSVFKTDAIDLSANLPYSNEKQRNNFNKRKDICQDFFCPFRQTGRSTFSVFYPEKFLTKTGVFVYY